MNYLEKVAIWKILIALPSSVLMAYFLLRLTGYSWTDKEFQVSLVLVFYPFFAGGVWLAIKSSGIAAGSLFGAPVERFSLTYLVFAVSSLLLFTFGSFYPVHYALSFHFPDYVNGVISEGTYVRPSESRYLWVLNIGMLLAWT